MNKRLRGFKWVSQLGSILLIHVQNKNHRYIIIWHYMNCFIYMHKLQSCRCTFVIFAFLFTIDQKKSAKYWIIKVDRTHPLVMKIAISKIANLCYYFDINQYFVEVKAKSYVYLCYHTLDIWRKLYGFVIKNLIRHRWHISFT